MWWCFPQVLQKVLKVPVTPGSSWQLLQPFGIQRQCYQPPHAEFSSLHQSTLHNRPETTHQVSLPLGPCVSTGNSYTSWALTNSRRAGCKHLSWLCHHSSLSLWKPMQVSDPVPVSHCGEHTSELPSWPHRSPCRKLGLEYPVTPFSKGGLCLCTCV